jgi:hypothetical protein
MTYQERVEQLARSVRFARRVAPRDATHRARALRIKGEPEVLWCDVWIYLAEKGWLPRG